MGVTEIMSDHFCYLRWKGAYIHGGTQGLLPGRQAPPPYLCMLLSFPPFYIFQLNFIAGGLGYIKFLAPPEKILRWIEGKLNLLGRLPHYVSVDQKTYVG